MRDFFRASIAKGQGRANPLFPATKTPRWKRWLFAFSAVAVPFGGGLFSVKVLSQPQFTLSNFEITGQACLDSAVITEEITAELSRPAGIFFTRANRFMFSAGRLEKRLTSNLPIEEAKISVDGSTLRIVIKEDVVMFLVNSNGNWLLIDLNGQILRTLTPEEVVLVDSPATPLALPLDQIPKIVLKELIAPDTTESVYPTTLLTVLGDLDQGLRKIGLTPSRYSLETRKNTWLSINVLEKDYLIYVDLERSIDAQLVTLESILSQQQELPDMSYLDLRFGNRVYMK